MTCPFKALVFMNHHIQGPMQMVFNAPMTTDISTVVRSKYDATFKQEVVNMVRNGRSVREISRSLGIGENLIYRWKSGTKISSATAEEGSLDQEVLYRRIRELEVERDILKKALAEGPGSHQDCTPTALQGHPQTLTNTTHLPSIDLSTPC